MGNFYLAQISNYTDRPDLLIAEIEKHDPGFVKRMNEASEHDATEMRAERFKFGKVQAYSSMFLSTGAAIAILCVLTLAVALGHIGFGTIIALGIFYAITQGGSSGFAKLITSISRAVERLRFGTNDSSSQTTKDHAEH
ncbi:hypothetical protein [Primorskyibacter flagellatus]|uniref:Uncharacterized protein n=1 Tax=Primorskyibacter flagellatus TaxID=1387277 RepID=A0A1W2AIE4_9RHOB|nr:hypothetical protein [Primorskyibacter flagellatus]SMC60282.1 hypothetical protein SAMN06295998_10334 [Primorskyibacter flagellatus]